MKALARTMRDEGVRWCDACDVLAYHYDQNRMVMPPPAPGVAATTTPAPRERWDLCASAAERIRDWMEGAPPPEPSFNLDAATCAACPAQHHSPAGACMACPPGHIAVRNVCTACNLGSVPAPTENRCQCVGPRHVNTPEGLCRECGTNEIATGPTTCTPCNLGSTVAPGENRCACPARHINRPGGLCEACGPMSIAISPTACAACGAGTPAANADRCLCEPHAFNLPHGTCQRCAANEIFDSSAGRCAGCGPDLVPHPEEELCIPEPGRPCGTGTLHCFGGQYCLTRALGVTGDDRCVADCADFGLFHDPDERTCRNPGCPGTREVPDVTQNQCVPCGDTEIEESEQCVVCGTEGRGRYRDGNACVDDCDPHCHDEPCREPQDGVCSEP
jgi:hypothetical protein